MALEDAYVLTEELAKGSQVSLEQVFARYQQRREKRVASSRKSANLFGKLYKWGGTTELTNTLRNIAIKSFPKKKLREDLGKAFAYKA